MFTQTNPLLSFVVDRTRPLPPRKSPPPHFALLRLLVHNAPTSKFGPRKTNGPILSLGVRTAEGRYLPPCDWTPNAIRSNAAVVAEVEVMETSEAGTNSIAKLKTLTVFKGQLGAEQEVRYAAGTGSFCQIDLKVGESLIVRLGTSSRDTIRAHLAEFGIMAAIGREGLARLIDLIVTGGDDRGITRRAFSYDA